MDYTKFLNKKEHVVLPYLGGAYVDGESRRLRIAGERPALGFHRFEVSGREARALEAVDTPDLSALPKVRGHLVEGWLVTAKDVVRVALLPEDEPAPLGVASARRWHSGDHVFDAFDFDGEAEDAARLLLERSAPLVNVKSVTPTLRIAYGIALARRIARTRDVPLAIREVAGHASSIADGGEASARAFVDSVLRQRIEHVARTPIVRAPLRTRGANAPTLENASARAEAALDVAHARMLASRRLSGGQLEVTFDFMGERFTSVVDALTLQVYDAGVCLAGEDDLVTLDSLPGVLREAIQTGRLVITR